MEARGCNHNLQVYSRAALCASEGNITRVPMDSRELHGLVSGGHHRNKELHGKPESHPCKPFPTPLGLFTSMMLPLKDIPGCTMLHDLDWLCPLREKEGARASCIYDMNHIRQP